jgi:4-amino-4-deoxy-L-arabinose transferase-like glycosyltransferase
LKYQKFIVTSAIIGYNVWVGNNPESKYTGELAGTEEINRYTNEKGLFAADEKGKQEVLHLLVSHPLEFISLQLTKTSIYFSAARPAAFWFHLHSLPQLLTIIFSSIFAYAIFTFGLAGLWRMAWRSDLFSRIFVLLSLAAPIGVIWVVAETRYRYQIYPMLIVLGVLFLHDFLKDKKAHWKVLVTSLLLVTANTAFDLLQNSVRVIERIRHIL